MRDASDRAITICGMENIDPVGVHTGDSAVVAPIMTLSDHDMKMLNDSAMKIIRALKIQGGCNVQFALNPDKTSSRSTRVSRSALAPRPRELRKRACSRPRSLEMGRDSLVTRRWRRSATQELESKLRNIDTERVRRRGGAAARRDDGAIHAVPRSTSGSSKRCRTSSAWSRSSARWTASPRWIATR